MSSANVFWDASFIAKDFKWEKESYIKSLGMYSDNYGVRVLIGNDYINELENFPDSISLAENIKSPSLFVGCKQDYANDAKLYYKFASKNKNVPKEIVIINSDHIFSALQSEQDLFDATLKFLKKY